MDPVTAMVTEHPFIVGLSWASQLGVPVERPS